MSQATASVSSEPHTATRHEDWPAELEQDPRWLLTLRVASGRNFVRAPLLSRFLLHIVAETLAGRQERITEHQIGVQVFGRPESYRTVEDNIVRNYARQLRRRLADHFVASPDEPMCIEIPLGAYVPLFIMRAAHCDKANVLHLQKAPQLNAAEVVAATGHIGSLTASRGAWTGIFVRLLLVALYSALLISLTYFFLRPHIAERHDGQNNILWQTLLEGTKTTYIVPPDAGFNLIEDLAHRPIPLADYIQGQYAQLPLSRFDEHSAQDLRTHEFTDFVDMQIVASLIRVPQYNPQRVFLRFPRDVRLDDLKNSNAVIIGSVCSNPWASLGDAKTNFHIVCSAGMQSSSIVNQSPLLHEQEIYASQWNQPTHTTYALIRLVPNLSGDGRLLLLEGLDVAGTQAAAEALLHSDAVESVIRHAKRSDGTLGSFEILLRATSIESNATGAEIIATRIH